MATETNQFSSDQALFIHKLFTLHKDGLKERLRLNKELFSEPVQLCDLHSHSNFSDGRSSVEEMNEWRREVGIDLLVVTDHRILAQMEDCKKTEGLWYGEEFPCDGHHFVALGIEEEVPEEGAAPEKLRWVNEKGGTLILAHPAGWMRAPYVNERYSDLTWIAQFGNMEIANGANNIINYWDETDRQAVELWDRILRQGKRMIGFGNSDAHIHFEVGLIFNGFLSLPFHPSSLVSKIREGNHFVSSGPFIALKVNGVTMGKEVEGAGRIEIELEACDAFHLRELSLIRNGEKIWVKDVTSEKSVRISLEDSLDSRTLYYRAECRSEDGARAYTNPIFIK